MVPEFSVHGNWILIHLGKNTLAAPPESNNIQFVCRCKGTDISDAVELFYTNIPDLEKIAINLQNITMFSLPYVN